MPRKLCWGAWPARLPYLLMGKHKPSYTPFIDTGDHVVVVNAEKVRLTGRKEEQKLYRRHSGYPGGLTETKARKVRETRPTRMIEEAIQGMLPEDQDGEADVPEAPGLRRSKAPSSGAEARRNDDRLRKRYIKNGVGTTFGDGPPQNERWRECFCGRARAPLL